MAFRNCLKWLWVASTLAAVLFGEQLLRWSGLAGKLLNEVSAACRDPGTQWMVFLCAGIYFVTFTVLGKRGVRNAERGTGDLITKHTEHTKEATEGLHSPANALPNHQLSTINFLNPDLWLCGLLLIASLHYAFNYDTASSSTQALMLLGGAAIGKGASLWANWGKAESRKAESDSTADDAECADGTNRKSEIVSPKSTAPSALNHQLGPRIRLILTVLLLLLATASLWHPEGAMQFQYRGLNRWSGPWDNPNIFGLLMGVGVVIAAGLLVTGFRCQVSGCLREAPPLRIVRGEGRGEVSFCRLGSWLWCLVLLVGMSCCAVGLLKSYSRGAWLGTGLGIAVLMFQVFKCQVSGIISTDQRQSAVKIPSCFSWLIRNRLPFAVLLTSVLVLAFWQFRYTEFHPVRRAFSVGNKNDFSWRNRVAAWEGALAMMADKPILGYGWNKPERVYDQFYRPAKVSEGMAIQLNHYFTLGMSLGLPVLICFLAYIRLALTRSAERGARNTGEANRKSEIVNQKSVCQAGAIVLLVGLWFDGGLFNLATGALLWTLLELGSGTALPACRGQRESGKALSRSSCISRFNRIPAPFFAAVMLITGLFWAQSRDPFRREWLSLKAINGAPFSAIAVMPDQGGPFPVVIWCHGSGGSAQNSGDTLQQFAELGMAAVGLEYDQTNQAGFDAQFAALLEAIPRLPWARSNSMAWVGNSLGAQRQLSYLLRNPTRQPAALVRLNGGMVGELRGEAAGDEPSAINHQLSTNLSVWIAHGENDEVFPASDARKVAELLQSAGAKVQSDIFPGRGHGFGEDKPILVRRAGEFCASVFGGLKPVPTNVRARHGLLWLPALLIVILHLAWVMRRNERCMATNRPVRWLTISAIVAGLASAIVTTAHLGVPSLRVTPNAVALAAKWCVRPESRADFAWLCSQPNAKNYRIGDLLEHLNLAGLQRRQFANSLSEVEWREFVLSPWGSGTPDASGWRREFWEWLAPRLRRESDIGVAAQIVARVMELRMHSDDSADAKSIRAAWEKGSVSTIQREAMLLVMLRSGGIPARLGQAQHCEILNNGKWCEVPRPLQP